MKINELRIGNIITRKYAPETFGTVMALDYGGEVHLSNAQNPDELHDLEGIVINETVMSHFGLLHPFTFQERQFYLEIGKGRTYLRIGEETFSIKYFHELQNKIFAFTGKEIIDPFDKCDEITI